MDSSESGSDYYSFIHPYSQIELNHIDRMNNWQKTMNQVKADLTIISSSIITPKLNRMTTIKWKTGKRHWFKWKQIWLLLLHSIITLKSNWMTMTEWIASNRYGFKWRQVFQSFLTLILTNQINIISIIEVIRLINSSNGDGSELRKIG